MKPAQWLGAIIALAVMVFLVTFALNYVGTSSPAKVDNAGGGNDQQALTFEATTLPKGSDEGDSPPLDAEKYQPGWLDYWFANDNDRPVTIGVFACCTCLEVEVSLLPLGAKKTAGEQPATTATLTAAGGETVTVQPRQAGWVRLKWTGRTLQPKMSARLWRNVKAASQTDLLHANVLWHEPLECEESALTFGRRDAADVANNTGYIKCWSVTRDTLAISGSVADERKGIPEPLEVGPAEKLSDGERKKLADKVPNLKVAYRVPVKLRNRTPDGKEIDAGLFHRRIALKVGDHLAASVEVSGIVAGDLHVSGLTAGGMIDFKQFDARQGSDHQRVNLQSSRQGLKLEWDRSRTAKFLDVKLEPKGADETGQQLWEMTVSVKPGAVSGPFPPDSAVYLRSEGAAKSRPTRIRVVGTATQ